MSIADELREFASHCAGGIGGDSLRHIANCIDAEMDDNKRFRREAEPFCDRLREASAERADVTLFGVAYTALPVDANGVPIRVGDWITGRWGAKAKVVAVTSDDVYWWESDGCHWCHAFEVHHYHEPTIKDVLREMAIEWEYEEDAEDREAVLEEYAAKLRLAKEDA